MAIDAKKLLQDMLAEGKELLDKGKGYVDQGTDYAADKLGAPEGSQNRNLYKNLAGGAAAAGALAVLLGTRSGGNLLKLGALVGIGSLAYKAYQKQSGGAEDDATLIEAASDEEADRRARTLLRAMIFAARADGRISQEERAMIEEKIAILGDDAKSFFLEEMMRDMDLAALAAEAQNPQEAREIYAMSALVCGPDDPAERAHLNGLAAALQLDAALATEIEAEARAAQI
ncbi:MAG: tellurite resistance TerB family protein [Neomegalonema sp.]|nr:tellurite resistance TerB family protein [Neomegalonema sp.]